MPIVPDEGFAIVLPKGLAVEVLSGCDRGSHVARKELESHRSSRSSALSQHLRTLDTHSARSPVSWCRMFHSHAYYAWSILGRGAECPICFGTQGLALAAELSKRQDHLND